VVAVGTEMVNARSGERFVWRATRESTGGAYCEWELILEPRTKVAAPHKHPQQEEQFSVLDGTLTVTADGRTSTLSTGESFVVPPGVAHAWGNAGEEGSRVLVRLTPALRTEEFFEGFCRVATAGNAARNGLPRNPLQLAVLLDAHHQEMAMANDRLHAVVSPLVRVVGWVGRQLGYRSDGHRHDDA
jgi:quercetin dioxygenase-like cupin family protein